MTKRGDAAKRAREARARAAKNAKKARQAKHESSLATRTENLRRGKDSRRAQLGLEKDALVQARAEGERHQVTPTGGADLGNVAPFSPFSPLSTTHTPEPTIHTHAKRPKRVATFRAEEDYPSHTTTLATTATVEPTTTLATTATAEPTTTSATTATASVEPTSWDAPGMDFMDEDYEEEKETPLSLSQSLGLSSLQKSWSSSTLKNKKKTNSRKRVVKARKHSKSVRFAGKADRMPSSAVLRHLISNRLGKNYLLVNLRRTTIHHKTLHDKPRRTCRLHVLAKHRSSGALKAYRGTWDLDGGKVTLTPLTTLKPKSPKAWTRLHSSRKGWSSYRLVD